MNNLDADSRIRTCEDVFLNLKKYLFKKLKNAQVAVLESFTS